MRVFFLYHRLVEAAFVHMDSTHKTFVNRYSYPGLEISYWTYSLDGIREPIVSGTHPRHVLCMRSTGAGKPRIWSRIGSGKAVVPAGEITFAPAQTEWNTLLGGERGEALSCMFDADFLHEHTGLGRDFGPEFLDACSNVGGARLVESLRWLAREMKTPGFAAEFLVESLGRVIMVELARHFRSVHASDEGNRGRLSRQRLDRILEYVQDTGAGLLTVNDIARACGLSAAHLRRSFKHTMGRTLHDYIEEVRVTKAKSLLAAADLTIKQIAFQLGFSNVNSFAIAFKRLTGATPKQYQLATAERIRPI